MGSKNVEKVFKNINVFRPHQMAKVTKNSIFLRKLQVFL